MTVNRARLRFSPGIVVDKEVWDKKKQRLGGLANLKGAHAAKVNKKLDEYAEFALSAYVKDPTISAAELKKKLINKRDGIKDGVPAEALTTLEGFAQYLVQWRKDNNKKERANNNLQTVANEISNFAIYREKPIAWDEVNLTFATELKTWLERPERDLAHNQICNIFDRVRYFMREASSEPGRLRYHNNPAYELSAFKLKEEDPYRQHFSEEELEQFLRHDFSGRPALERVRDMFVLNCYTGLRRGDAKRVDRTHVVTTGDGKQKIKIWNEKTNKFVYIPLFPIAKQLLEKYNYSLPVVEDQYYNRALKEAAELAGLTTEAYHTETRAGRRRRLHFRKCDKISSHDARRSFATNFFEMGFPSALLMQITGHVTEKQFIKYICTTPAKAAEKMHSLFDELMELREEKKTRQALEARVTAPKNMTDN